MKLRRVDEKFARGAFCLLALAAGLLHAREVRAQWTQPDANNNINNTNTGNVGVGTTAPGRKLDIKGPDIRFGNYTDDAGVTRNDSVSNILYIARSSRSDQNTGIGPGYSHKAMITTNETGQWVTDVGAMIMLRSSYTTLGNAYYPYAWAGGNVELYYKRPGAMVAPYTSSTKFYDDTTSLPAYTNLKPELGFILNSAGNVGIGNNSPHEKLEVTGNVALTDGSGVARDVHLTGNAGALRLFAAGSLTASPAGAAVQFFGNGSGLTGQLYLDSGAHDGAAIIFRTAQNSGTIAERLRVTSGGNVGIGTASPQARLGVVQTNGTAFVALSGGASAHTAVQIGRTGAEGSLGVAGGAGHYTLDAAAGDIILRTETTSSRLLLANGPGNAALAVAGGRVGVGTSSPSHTLEVAGTIHATEAITGATISATYQDVAEWVPSTEKLQAGTVVVLNPARVNHVLASASAYDTKVAGVVSAQPGVILGVGGEGKVMVATTGRVKVKVDATRGAVKVGDLLVTSGVEGVAMKSIPVDLGGTQIHRPGTIIGKALEPLEKGTGEILVLLSLQ